MNVSSIKQNSQSILESDSEEVFLGVCVFLNQIHYGCYLQVPKTLPKKKHPENEKFEKNQTLKSWSPAQFFLKTRFFGMFLGSKYFLYDGCGVKPVWYDADTFVLKIQGSGLFLFQPPSCV